MFTINNLTNRLSFTLKNDRCMVDSEGNILERIEDTSLSKIAAVLSSRGDFPSITERQLMGLSVGELIVVIEEYLTGKVSDSEQILRGCSDAVEILRNLLQLLLNMDEEEECEDGDGGENRFLHQTLREYFALYLPYCTCFADELYTMWHNRFLEHSESSCDDTALGTVLFNTCGMLYCNRENYPTAVLQVMNLLVWPVAQLERMNGVTCSKVIHKLQSS